MDIAEIGFKADTSDLDKATLSLNRLKAAAGGTASASKSASEASVRVAAAKAAEARATLAAVKASENASKQNIKAAAEALRLARAEELKARSMLASARAAESLAKATQNVSTANSRAFNTAAEGRGRSVISATGVRIGSPGDAPLERDQMPNRFNTANLAAQFQDIGVTASMGMSPLTIAIQQGTQLSAILNTMESPLKGIAEAFRSIINPVSLISIALVALVAAAIQFTDWASVAETVLNSLADAIDTFGIYVLGAAAALTVAFIPALVKSIITMGAMAASATVTGAAMAAAWLAANPLVLVGALIALSGAIATFAVTSIQPIRDFVNTMIGLFVGGFNGIKKTWEMLPAVLGEASFKGLNIVIDNFESLINTIIPAVNKLLEKLPEWMGGGMKIEPIELGNINSPYAGALDDFNAEIRQAVQNAQADYVGMGVNAVKNMTTSLSNSLREAAAGIGSGTDDKKGGSKKDPWEEITKAHERRMNELRTEQASIGKSAQEVSRLKYETELLNEAQQKNIELNSEQIRRIREMAVEMSELEAQTKRSAEAYDFLKDSSKGFVATLRAGLEEGKSLWESFTSAISGLLDKLADKLIDAGIDQVFGALFPANDNGGILQSLGDFLFSANGNAFDRSGVSKFAKGGTFTNGVYANPTMFAFANGGSFGVMGEAGPEAVMPLHRGPDGSLGVKADSYGGSAVVVNINNYSNSNASVEQRQTSQGVEIDVVIDEIVGEKLSQVGTNSNNSLKAFNNRKLTQR